ncbi:hypothetical protein LTR37_000024 [Vermiconidia calcicola]|uniref:Uncharacterized protein n=1 Tax=Vermiconidia calcicola TaxID=1690605 RepID=A0ACC3NZC1_9PEZI|nr:hypothetical protein LTR37_000024 [Vermiconidia calcicola]
MATTSQYQCKTQDGGESTIGFKPSTPLSSKGSSDRIVLGLGRIVPRWDVLMEPNRKLQYFAAAGEWNQLELGLVIAPTDDRDSANFYLRYMINPPEEPTVLAKAFFPNQVGQDVIVYSCAFEPDNRSTMKVVFLHELGHVLGLRHEFAIELEGQGAVRFMGKDENSVMSYIPFPTKLQNTDKEGVKAFYKLDNGYHIDPERDQPVTDFWPQLRATVRRRGRQSATVQTQGTE